MNTATKKEVKGTPGVNASQAKPNVPTPNVETTEEKTSEKSKSIEDQMKFFDGLSKLVNFKRRFETHKEALVKLDLPVEEQDKFESQRKYDVCISLQDDSGSTYEITNPKLVQEVRDYLISLIDAKIKECDESILGYGK